MSQRKEMYSSKMVHFTIPCFPFGIEFLYHCPFCSPDTRHHNSSRVKVEKMVPRRLEGRSYQLDEQVSPEQGVAKFHCRISTYNTILYVLSGVEGAELQRPSIQFTRL